MTANQHSYDRLFYAYHRDGSYRSAMAVLPHVLANLQPRSVLDVGCGAGAWLAAYGQLGVKDCVGVDGAYVDRALLMVDAAAFVPANLSSPVDLEREFDLVQCLEVAEHVDATASETLLNTITRHGKRVLFSAAVPGQGGEDHINEQAYEHWRDRFAARGYRLYDFIRPLIQGHRSIEPWYRYNTLFFAHESVASALPASVLHAQVASSAAIADHSPWALRAQRRLLRFLSHRAMTRLAVFKHRVSLHSLSKR